MKDNVNHPKHYNTGKIEVIEFIEDQKLDYHSGNSVKYICRAGRKDPEKEIEDVEKALWYLKRKLELLQATKEKREPKRPNAMNAPSISATGVWNSLRHGPHPGIAPDAPTISEREHTRHFKYHPEYRDPVLFRSSPELSRTEHGIREEGNGPA